MIKVDNIKIDNNSFIDLKENDWIDKQRIAGKIVADTLTLIKNIVNENYSKYSLLELNNIAEQFIITNNSIPTFKNFHGFPYGVCISVNENVVHGIPDNTYLKSGDVVSFDLGATVDGVIADSALTIIVDKAKDQKHIDLVKSCQDCLYSGIKAIKIGSRLGIVGEAINRTAIKSKFASITQYGGHGISYNKPHASPFVSNKSTPYEGIRIQRGLSIAIEPMLVYSSSNETYTLDDGWTVKANGISSHFEHTVMIHNDHLEVMTLREDDTLPHKIYYEN